MGLFGGVDSVQLFLELCSVEFYSVLQWYTKQLVVDGIDVGPAIGACLSYPDFEAFQPYLDGIRDVSPCII